MEKTLRNLQVNKKGVITKIVGEDELIRRIRDLGITPGSTIFVVGKAPLYDPVAIKVKDCVVTLRNNEADKIFVEEV